MEVKEGKEEEYSKKTALLLEDLASLESYVFDLFAFSPFPVCFASPVGVILEFNPAFEQVSGYNSYEIIGEGLETLFNEREVKELLEETTKEETARAREMTLTTKDKRTVPVSVFCKARKDEEKKTVGFFIGVFDLSETKGTEEELKSTQTAILNILEDVDEARIRIEEEKDKTLAVITNFADGLLVFDKENKLSLINPQMEDFLGVKAKEVFGKSILELASSPSFAPLLRLLTAEGKGEIKKIHRGELPLRENLVLEVSAVPLKREREEVENLIIVHDITREKRIEQLKTEFVSLSAHQLRTPLSAIKWTLRMLLGGDLGKLTDEQKDYIGKTAESTERIIGLINDLLNVTRIEEGKYLYKPTLLPLKPLIQSIINAHKEEVARKRIKCEFSKPKKLPPIRLDEEKIKLAIQNIFDNAVRYTLVGGEVKVSLKYDKKKREVEFSVRDSGIGIPKDQQERVFTKFFRGSNAMRMATEGTGLGLYITRHIIEAHGGKIWFESEVNKGSTFYVTLPVEEVGRGDEKEVIRKR